MASVEVESETKKVVSAVNMVSDRDDDNRLTCTKDKRDGELRMEMKAWGQVYKLYVSKEDWETFKTEVNTMMDW